jgi:hypothetical protein
VSLKITRQVVTMKLSETPHYRPVHCIDYAAIRTYPLVPRRSTMSLCFLLPPPTHPAKKPRKRCLRACACSGTHVILTRSCEVLHCPPASGVTRSLTCRCGRRIAFGNEGSLLIYYDLVSLWGGGGGGGRGPRLCWRSGGRSWLDCIAD